MGVPTLTLRGETQASLQTHGILDSYGLSEWSCGSKDEYMQKVLYWSENTERLADLRQQMRPNMLNSLGNTSKSGVLGVERAFRHMWSRYISGLPPESFRLDA
jgi:predicted O-linked N-acetylglucosamine transferase (SPINDLY family)